MECDTILPESRSGRIKYAGLISLPGKSPISDVLFHEKWGASLIRPTQDLTVTGVCRNRDDQDNLDLSQEALDFYIKKAKSILNDLKRDFENVIFIDVRITPDNTNDVILNYFNYISSDFIQPILNNMQCSSWKFSLNLSDGSCLLKRICEPNTGIHGFQLIISDRMFSDVSWKIDKNNELGPKIFEEILIFAHLAITGRVA